MTEIPSSNSRQSMQGSITKCIFSVTMVAVTIQAISSFQIITPTLRKYPSAANTIQHHNRRGRQQQPFPSMLSLSSEKSEAEEQKAYDSLYEFLTKRSNQASAAAKAQQQQQQQDKERKIDRIRKWVTKSSSSSKMVQPLRVEDGSVMEDVEPELTTRLDKVWSAMPTLEDILSRRTRKKDKASIGGNDSNNNNDDDSWFEAEKQQIQAEYDSILQQMKQQIALERQQNPDSVPENSEAIAESVVAQELKRMLTSVKINRAKESLQDEEIRKKAELERRDFSQDNDAIAKKLLQEAADDWKRQEAIKANIDDFEQYDRQARLDSSNTNDSNSNIPQPGADLDVWALERLEDMLEKTAQEGSDVSISDILEENIETLQQRLAKASQKGTVEPQTMKEWQMYRAIATRLNARKDNSGMTNPLLNQAEADEQFIQAQLNRWREYIGKEQVIRERSGLSSGPKMPFDWNKSKQQKEQELAAKSRTQQQTQKTKNEMRRQVNLQAIQALEDLIQKSDPKRAENLQKQLDALKAELEPLDYLDVSTEDFAEVQGPVDLSGVFRSEPEDMETTIEPAFGASERESIDKMMSDQDYSIPAPSKTDLTSAEASKAPSFYDDADDDDEPKPAAPKTPFFQDMGDDEPKPEPPNSPFFASDDSAGGAYAQELGSMEEQKLNAMFRRAGARTKEEQDTIRAEWQSFQAFEKSSREASGLSNSDDDESRLEDAILKFNVSEVMTSDGDIDAAKVLASIGPRPTRRKKVVDESTPSAVDPSDISEAMYRSVSAVGGGRSKDDPSIRDKEKADFEEYMRKEEEMRQSLDSIDDDASKLASEDVPMYDESYAENALASMERPIFKRKKRIIDEQEYSDRGGALYSEDESLSDSDDDDDDEMQDDSSDNWIPNWLKKERKEGAGGKTSYFSGNKMDDVFDDDKYEHNLRQVAEYKQRRSGNKKQMGIDISDVLGRQESDDYADYTYDADYFRGRQGGWETASFEARKSNLLEYIELSVPELNNLLDHKESSFSNGASQYIPRINKPFSEFGAIFRLEGVMFDLTGIHDKVWAMVAQEFGFKVPQFEDVQRAAVARPDFSIRRIFCWSNEMMEVNKINDRFLSIFRETLNEWAAENGLKVENEPAAAPVEQSSKGSMALGEEVGASKAAPQQPMQQAPPMFTDERTKMMKMKESWEKTANHYNFAAPSNDQIAQCSFLSPDITIRNIFRWTSDQREIELIVSHYSQLLAGVEPVDRQQNTASAKASELGGGSILELQFSAWEKVAKQTSMQTPTPEEVLAASVLNDPAEVIAHGFGWTKDPARIEELATLYRDVFAQLVNEGFHNRSYQSNGAPVPIEKPIETAEPSSTGPSAEEILQSQIEAWNEVSREHGLLAPAHSQIELTMNMSAGDSVRRLLGWTHNFNNDQISAITASYEKALQKSSSKILEAYGLETEQVNTNDAIQHQTGSTDVGADEVFKAATDAWTKVADRMSFSAPSQEQVVFAMTVGPEEGIISGFGWASNMSDAAKIAADYREEIKLKRAQWHRAGMTTNAGPSSGASVDESTPLVKIIPGVEDWINSLRSVEMGCGVISHLEEDQVDILLEYAGLSSLLPKDKRVTKNQNYDRDSQQMLGSALRMERRPDHCVVFDSSPQANIATQEIDMRSVAMVGPYPRYELLSADTSAFSFGELTAMNIRRLFGERVYDQPMLDALPQAEPLKKTKVKTRFWDPED
ncbi:unnamed protein product [Cylindrotheca closterium]|uniref:Uncharacterized protein n=1 Tax=Cylindrotheca closterium TaxID=2856 RepID=A0AAD2GDE8_9STRA|nr:unnamed protein product [Cylindrotheca closterium]